MCSRCVCVQCCVCTLGWVNAEHEFRVWVTILGCMSRHFDYQRVKGSRNPFQIWNGGTKLKHAQCADKKQTNNANNGIWHEAGRVSRVSILLGLGEITSQHAVNGTGHFNTSLSKRLRFAFTAVLQRLIDSGSRDRSRNCAVEHSQCTVKLLVIRLILW